MDVRSYYVNHFEPLYTLRTQTGVTTRPKPSVDVQAAMMSLLLRRQAYFGVGTEYSPQNKSAYLCSHSYSLLQVESLYFIQQMVK